MDTINNGLYIAKVDKDRRLYDDNGYPILLWSAWLDKLNIKIGDKGRLYFIKDGDAK